MELTTDIYLRGTAWSKAIEALSPIFKTRTHYMIYILAMTIGIMYDQRIEKPDEDNEDVKSVPRNVLQNNDNGKLDFIFQAAILSTTTEQFEEEERLDLAFGEKTNFKKILSEIPSVKELAFGEVFSEKDCKDTQEILFCKFL